jgi:hypothetical protein
MSIDDARAALNKASKDRDKFSRSIALANQAITALHKNGLPIPEVSHRFFGELKPTGRWDFEAFIEFRWDNVHMIEIREDTILGNPDDEDFHDITDKNRIEKIISYVGKFVL